MAFCGRLTWILSLLAFEQLCRTEVSGIPHPDPTDEPPSITPPRLYPNTIAPSPITSPSVSSNTTTPTLSPSLPLNSSSPSLSPTISPSVSSNTTPPTQGPTASPSLVGFGDVESDQSAAPNTTYVLLLLVIVGLVAFGMCSLRSSESDRQDQGGGGFSSVEGAEEMDDMEMRSMSGGGQVEESELGGDGTDPELDGKVERRQRSERKTTRSEEKKKRKKKKVSKRKKQKALVVRVLDDENDLVSDDEIEKPDEELISLEKAFGQSENAIEVQSGNAIEIQGGVQGSNNETMEEDDPTFFDLGALMGE